MEEEKNLSQLFTDGWRKFRSVCDSNESFASKIVQESIEECQKVFTTCTEMVNQLQLFSKNEVIAEVSTENIKFLLLPVFLGELSLMTTIKDRKLMVLNAQVYLKDFLKRCFEYQLTTKDLSTEEKEKKITHRAEKIQRYKETKELNSKIDAIDKRLKEAPDTVDEETRRGYYLDWLQIWLNKSIENMDLIKSELEILEHMQSLKPEKVPPPPSKEPRKPMKPILITREMMKKEVFGAGYRSLPGLTLDEFFQEELAGKIVQEYEKGSSKQQKKEEHSSDEDNEEKLKEARAWDEWKDTHRRGEGNKERHG